MTVLDFDRQHLWHPYDIPPADTRQAGQRPLYEVASADGVHLILKDGSRLIDAMSSWWSVIHGYNHPAITSALHRQLDTLPHVMFGGITHEPASQLGQLLLAMAPDSLNTIFYADSGSIAVEVAMKMALQYQYAKDKAEKNTFLTIRSGYHGDTWQAMSVCDPETGMHHLFKGALAIQHFTPQPPIGFHQTWDDNPQQNGLADLRAILENNHGTIAAIILEPVLQGAGGMYFYHPEYLNQCRALCDEFEILLIFDEIATGFGRTGKLFALEHTEIEPDILCLGKALTGGYLSLAATLCSANVADTIADNPPGIFMHGPTFMANPLACSAAIASLELLNQSDWQTKVADISEQLKAELAKAETLSGVKEVRVLGAVGVIEMKQAIRQHEVHGYCKTSGVWLRPFGNNIYCMPPYCINSEQLTQVTTAMVSLASSLSE